MVGLAGAGAGAQPLISSESPTPPAVRRRKGPRLTAGFDTPAPRGPEFALMCIPQLVKIALVGSDVHRRRLEAVGVPDHLRLAAFAQPRGHAHQAAAHDDDRRIGGA